MEKTKEIGWLEKGAFALTNLGNIPIMTLINSFLLVYYVDVIGINPTSVGTLFLITRVFDGINDPLMGYIIDHLPETKMGRFRPYIIIGAILASLNYLLLWFGPLLFPGFQLGIVYISYFLIGLTFDLMDIPLNSMLPVITDDLEERNKLSALKGISYTIGGAAIGIVAPQILAAAETQVEGYSVLIIAGTLITLVFSIVGALGLKERVKPISEENYKLKDLIPMLLERPVRVTFIAQLFAGIGNALAGATGMFFVLYVLDKSPEILSMIGLLSLAGAFIGMLFSSYITNKLGKKVAYSSGLLIFSIFSLLRLFDVTNIPLLYICTTIGAIGGGLMITLQYGIQADNVDYIEYRFKHRAEGALASSNSFLAKAGQAIGGALPGYILGLVGYIPNAQQTPLALNGIIFISIILPAAFMIIAALIFLFRYNLDKDKIEFTIDQLNVMRNEDMNNIKSKKALYETAIKNDDYD